MKFTWCKNISNLAAWNSAQIEEVDMSGKYQEMLQADQGADEFDIQEDEYIFKQIQFTTVPSFTKQIDISQNYSQQCNSNVVQCRITEPHIHILTFFTSCHQVHLY